MIRFFGGERKKYISPSRMQQRPAALKKIGLWPSGR